MSFFLLSMKQKMINVDKLWKSGKLSIDIIKIFVKSSKKDVQRSIKFLEIGKRKINEMNINLEIDERKNRIKMFHVEC